MKKLNLGLSVALLLAATAAAAGPDNLSDLRDLMDRGMYWTAEQQLTVYAEENKKDAESFALLCEARLKTNDAAGAELAARDAVDLDEENPAYWKLWGQAFFEMGVAAVDAHLQGNTIKSFFADAEMKFRQAIKLDPKSDDLVWRLGWAKEWQEYPKEAEKFFKSQIAKFPDHPAGYRRLAQKIATDANKIGGGQTPEAKKHRQGALDLFEQGLEKAGDDAESLYLYGFALAWQDEKEAEKEAYLRAMAADPDFEKAWNRANKVGIAPEKLEEMAAKLLTSHPHAATPATWYGFFLNGRNEAEKALDLLLPALAAHGDSVGLYNQAFIAGNKALAQKKTALALEAFAKIHESYAWSGDAANNLGLYYRDSGQYEKSLEWYVKASERMPQSQDILNDTALIYLFHFSGAKQKQCLPILEQVVAFVTDDGQKPERGYWDALENLCKYYWEVDRQPAKVVEFARMRYEVTDEVSPYNNSPKSAHYGKLAEKALGR